MGIAPDLDGTVHLLWKLNLITGAENRKPSPENLQQPADPGS